MTLLQAQEHKDCQHPGEPGEAHQDAVSSASGSVALLTPQFQTSALHSWELPCLLF